MPATNTTSASDEPIIVDLRGTRFLTCKGTLVSEPDSMLGKVCATAKSDQMVYIDRDPKVFRHILELLRLGEKAQLPECKEILAQLKADVAFYKLDGLKKFIDRRVTVSGPDLISSTAVEIQENIVDLTDGIDRDLSPSGDFRARKKSVGGVQVSDLAYKYYSQSSSSIDSKRKW